jgi:hypothetical protein
MVAPGLWLKRPIAFSNLAVFPGQHVDHGADDIPADVCADGSRPFSGGCGLCLDHAAAWLAMRSNDCFAAVYAVRIAANHDYREHLHSARNLSARHAWTRQAQPHWRAPVR